ncbi:LOW QUALITY PROTEIN: uncharacterized protein LOC120432803 [Oreochromis aureus]|uniref:LOW QUALITY PROTEIN: uncharacterized protein LOC120432803 n=1 Tax=Oreochromis aureus TaxID=47969 RepID=UPI001953867B|nr:LOW QUALITY PROTEIN: uncharacterized protein LOC120432803 [Oreochromis aureus]
MTERRDHKMDPADSGFATKEEMLKQLKDFCRSVIHAADKPKRLIQGPRDPSGLRRQSSLEGPRDPSGLRRQSSLEGLRDPSSLQPHRLCCSLTILASRSASVSGFHAVACRSLIVLASRSLIVLASRSLIVLASRSLIVLASRSLIVLASRSLIVLASRSLIIFVLARPASRLHHRLQQSRCHQVPRLHPRLAQPPRLRLCLRLVQPRLIQLRLVLRLPRRRGTWSVLFRLASAGRFPGLWVGVVVVEDGLQMEFVATVGIAADLRICSVAATAFQVAGLLIGFVCIAAVAVCTVGPRSLLPVAAVAVCTKWDSKSMATILKEEEELRKIEELITCLEAVNGSRLKKQGELRAAASQPVEDLWGLPDGTSQPRPLGSCRSSQGMLQAPGPRAASQPPLMVVLGSSTPSLLAAEGDKANCLQDPVQLQPPSGAPVRGSMKLPRYNGEAPPETYLIQVQLAAQLNGWSTEETAVQVALALEGRALQILTDLQPEERLSWPAVARAMQSRFGLRTHADDARDKLASRPRRQEESLGAYAADLCLYARRGYPAFDAAAQEELALQAFVRGLQPKRLQEHIRLHAPETLAAALTEAERVEHAGVLPGTDGPRPQGWQPTQLHITKEVPLPASTFSASVRKPEDLSPLAVEGASPSPAVQQLSTETKLAVEDLYQRSCEGLQADQQRQLREILDLFADIFAAKDEDCMQTSLVQHDIDTGDAQPICLRPRRLPLPSVAAEQKVREMAEAGIIEPSNSPWAAPAVLVRKKDGTWRFCVDYRLLNSVTRKDSYPLPRIDDALDDIAGSCWFSSLDLRSGYWQVELTPEARPKTAFSIGQGLWQFKVMPFGLCNAPATFERLMERVLADIPRDCCVVYLDDLLVHATDFEKALANLTAVFHAIRQAGLRLHPKKCHLFRKETTFLGHVVSGAGVSTDPAKVAAVKDWPIPGNPAELRSFLGLASYYRRFVKDFATIASPCTSSHKGREFRWSEDCAVAFDRLRSALVEAPVLAYPDLQLPFVVDTDASNTGVGAVLSQEGPEGERVISYYSRSLSRPERNYCVTRRELLAIILGLHHFRPYLYGKKFLLRTDHASLTWLLSFKEPEGQLARWLETLQDYHFEVRHDFMLDWGWSETIMARSICTGPRDQGSLLPMGQPHNGLLYRRWQAPGGHREVFQLLVPQQLRSRVLQLVHGAAGAGHFGVTKTLRRLRSRFYWPGCRQDVELHVHRCDACTAQKGPSQRSHAPLQQYQVGAPMERVGVDILGPFPTTDQGNHYVLIAMDYFTKWPEAYAVPDQSAVTTAERLVNEMFCRFGVPEELHSDQGRNFKAAVFKEVCQRLGIRKTRTTPLHPQSDGLVERFNHTLATQLAILTSRQQRDWDQHLPLVLMAYCSAVQESTKCTPAALMFGHELRTPVDLVFGSPPEQEVCGDPGLGYLHNLLARLREVHQLTRQALRDAGSWQKRAYDTRCKGEGLLPGQHVWVYSPERKKGLSQTDEPVGWTLHCSREAVRRGLQGVAGQSGTGWSYSIVIAWHPISP